MSLIRTPNEQGHAEKLHEQEAILQDLQQQLAILDSQDRYVPPSVALPTQLTQCMLTSRSLHYSLAGCAFFACTTASWTAERRDTDGHSCSRDPQATVSDPDPDWGCATLWHGQSSGTVLSSAQVDAACGICQMLQWTLCLSLWYGKT